MKVNKVLIGFPAVLLSVYLAQGGILVATGQSNGIERVQSAFIENMKVWSGEKKEKKRLHQEQLQTRRNEREAAKDEARREAYNTEQAEIAAK